MHNRLLDALPDAECERLRPDLELVPLPLGMAVYESGGKQRHVYFPTSGIVSLLYVLADGGSAMGTPAFLTSGKVVGLLTLRQIEPGRPSMASMFGGSESMGMLGVILPAADVLEIARQAPEK